MKNLLILFSLTVASTKVELKAAYLNDFNLGIRNGSEVEPYSIPYQVYILLIPPFNPLDIKDRWICGGILITSKFVLTSARCVEGANVITPMVGIDSPRNSTDGQFFNLNNDTTIIHEDYDQATLENNIALIEVPGFNLTDKVEEARLPLPSEVDINLVGKEGRLSGYSTDARTETEHLMVVNNTIISIADCSEIYSFIRDTEICVSGEQGKRACIKDEGGPLTVENIVQGIISFRNVTCESTLPTVATRISKYINWIEKHSDWKPQTK